MAGDSEIKVNITGDSHGGVVAVEDMRAELERLTAQVAQLSAHQAAFAGGGDSFASAMSQMGLSFGTLGFQVGGLNVNLGAMLSQMGVLGEIAGPAGLAAVMIGGIGSQVMGVADGFAHAAEQALQFAEALASQAMQQGLQYVEQLGQQAFQINNQVEKTQFGWGFMIGNEQPTGPGGSFVDVSGNSKDLMHWVRTHSFDMPFTWTDMMQATTNLAAMKADAQGDKFSPQQIEDYLPLVSDIAATYGATGNGGQGVTLAQAAYAIRDATMGFTRPLKTQLNINPEDLIQYGLDANGVGIGMHVNDTSTVLPALKKWAEAHHLIGASKAIAHQTFFGEYSSFIDRTQSMLLAAGGYDDATGEAAPGTFFGTIKSDLEAISDWYDAHKDALQAVASLAAKVGGGVIGGGNQIFGGFFDAMDKSGIAADLMKQLTRFGSWLNDPQTQKDLHDFGDLIGNVVAPGLKDAGSFLDALATGVANSGIGQDILGTLRDLSRLLKDPETQKELAAFGDAFGKIAGSGAKDVFDALKDLLGGLGASGAGDVLLKDLQGIGAWLADPAHQEDIRNFAYVAGVVLGDSFSLASADAHLLIDSLVAMTTILKDVAAVMKDELSGNIAQASIDLTQLAQDWQNFGPTITTDLGQAALAGAKLVHDVTTPATRPQGTFAKTGPIGAQRAHDAAVAAGSATPSSGGAVDGYSSDFSDLGSQHAQSYLTGFHAAVRDQTGPDLVQAFTDGVNRQLSNGSGDVLASRLATFIDQRTRQAIADALANMDLTSNGSRTQAGGPGHQAFTPY